MPIGGLPADALSSTGWTQILAEDFNTNCAEGGFLAAYPGWIAYLDTWDNGHTSYYNGGNSIRVSGGVLKKRIFTDGTGKHRTEAIRPPSGQGQQQQFGVYEIAYRVRQALPGYKQAWLLWPASNNGNDGEIDFPEADFNSGASTIRGFIHEIEPPGVHENNAFSANSGIPVVGSSWHVCRISWYYPRVEFHLDGVLQNAGYTNTTHVPNIEMTWRIQTEGNLSGTFANSGIDPTTMGDVEIAYAAVWEPT